MPLRNFSFGLFLAAVLATSGAIAADSPPARTPEVTVEVFADFQCPYCAQFSKTVDELRTKGIEGTKTTVTYKHFPLSFHPYAQLAHQAAAAAEKQGKFWEMHDMIYANQAAMTRDDLLRYADKLNLNIFLFLKDLDSEDVKQSIAADSAEGMRLGVEGTPTFFLNGKRYSGTMPFEQIKKLVQDDQIRARAISEIPGSLMSKGPADAPVTVEFFADLESPISQSANHVLDDMLAHFPSTVRVQFRNFPLAFHPQAALAHDAAMAAARQGHFWEVANYILDHQDSLREQDLIAYAGRLGIDETKFAAMVQSREYAPRVDADLADGLRRGVRGSPVIFVNGRRIDGVPSIQILTDYVEAELAAKQAPRGTKP
jgi:protein-disulfide isomerase